MENIEILEGHGDIFLQEDLEGITESNIPLEELKDKTVFVTGATGLIGSLLVRTLLCCNRKKNTNIRILALVRNRDKAEKVFNNLLKNKSIEIVVGDVTGKLEVNEKIDYIFHCASVTASKLMISKPVDVIRTSINGTENMLELAREKSVKSMVYVSSMEMYGSFTEDPGKKVSEDMLGYINPLRIRSNYPESKRMCENMCVAYAAQYHVPVKIARLAQTFGAGVLPGENRVFAQFARSAMNGSDIVLHTQGKSEGNYCYTSDVMRALLILLVKGKDAEAYNIANAEAHITIAAMANMVATEIAEKPVNVIFDIPDKNLYGYANDTKMHLDASKMEALGWKPEVNLKEAYKRLIGSMQYQNL